VKPFYSSILIIPCFNEEKRLNLTSFSTFIADNPDFYLLFVNDGSFDNTGAHLSDSSALAGRSSVLNLAQNSGKAEAVRAGFLYCFSHYDFNYIGFADADLSTPLDEFLSFRMAMQQSNKVQIVLGSRVQILGKNIQRSLVRHWFSRIIATAICKVIDEPVYDTQCGAKLFSRQIAEELFADKFISKWLFDVELLSRYKRSHGSVAFKQNILEIPVSAWTEQPDSKLKYHFVFRILADLWSIRNFYFRQKK